MLICIKVVNSQLIKKFKKRAFKIRQYYGQVLI